MCAYNGIQTITSNIKTDARHWKHSHRLLDAVWTIAILYTRFKFNSNSNSAYWTQWGVSLVNYTQVCCLVSLKKYLTRLIEWHGFDVTPFSLSVNSRTRMVYASMKSAALWATMHCTTLGSYTNIQILHHLRYGVCAPWTTTAGTHYSFTKHYLQTPHKHTIQKLFRQSKSCAALTLPWLQLDGVLAGW